MVNQQLQLRDVSGLLHSVTGKARSVSRAPNTCEIVPNQKPVPPPTQQRTQRRLSWDVVRVVAIFAVVVQHVTHQGPINHPELGPYPITIPIQFGASTLLVISAYFVCVTVRRGSTGRWLWGRLARLLPAYFLAVVATYLISRFAVAVFQNYHFNGIGGLLFGDPVSAGPAGSAPPWYLPNLTDFLGNFFMVEAWSPKFHWIDASYWTLPVQVTAFVTAAVAWRRGWWRARISPILWSVVIIPVILRFTWRTEDSAQWIKSVFDGLSLHRVALFGAGVAIWLWTREKMSGKHLAAYLVAVLIAQDAHAYFADTWSTVALGLAFAGIVAAAGGPDWVFARRFAPVITWLAGISYGVYLVHQELGFVLARVLLDRGVHPWERIVACVAMAIALGWLLTRVVERPAHRWLTTVAPSLVGVQPQAGMIGSPAEPPRPASHPSMAAAVPFTSSIDAPGITRSHLC
jgi:peptidoglycan/LPS O-acetylase OafA/YrhL